MLKVNSQLRRESYVFSNIRCLGAICTSLVPRDLEMMLRLVGQRVSSATLSFALVACSDDEGSAGRLRTDAGMGATAQDGASADAALV